MSAMSCRIGGLDYRPLAQQQADVAGKPDREAKIAAGREDDRSTGRAKAGDRAIDRITVDRLAVATRAMIPNVDETHVFCHLLNSPIEFALRRWDEQTG